MSGEIIKFISGKLRIFSLLFILATLIIKVNGGVLGNSVKTCQSNLPTVQKEILDRVELLFHEDTGTSMNLPKTVEWKVKHCNVKLEKITYSIKVPVTQGKKTEKYKYLAYVQKNKIIDVRSMMKIDAEKNQLKKMRKSKITNNAADVPQSVLDETKDKIVSILSTKLKSKVIPKHFVKTKLGEYNEETNQILYHVTLQMIIREKTCDKKYVVSVRYKNGKQEITGINSIH